MGLRRVAATIFTLPAAPFQSRCQDSWGCDTFDPEIGFVQNPFQSRCQDSWGCDTPFESSY